MTCAKVPYLGTLAHVVCNLSWLGPFRWRWIKQPDLADLGAEAEECNPWSGVPTTAVAKRGSVEEPSVHRGGRSSLGEILGIDPKGKDW